MPTSVGKLKKSSLPTMINTSYDDSGPSSSSSTDDSPAESPIASTFAESSSKRSSSINGMTRSNSSSNTQKARSSTLSRSNSITRPALVGLGFGGEVEEEWADLSPFDPLQQNNYSQGTLGSRRPSAISITDYPSDVGHESSTNLLSPQVSMSSPMLGATGGWSNAPSRPTSPRLPTLSTHLDPGSYPTRRASVNSSHSPTGSSSSLHSAISIQPTPNLSASTSSTIQGPPSPNLKHGRQISLTSACLPATASYTPSLGSNKFDAILEDGGSRGSPVPGLSSPTLGSNGDRNTKEWKPFNWMANGLPETQEKLSARPKATANSKSFMMLPYGLVSLLLGPFSSLLLPAQPPAKSNASVSALPTPPKKAPLPVRLFSVFYVCFSLLYLTSRIMGYQSLGGFSPSAATAADTHRLIPRTANDGRPAMQLALNGWAEGFAKGLREKMPAAGAIGKMWDNEDLAEQESYVEASENGVEHEEVIIEESVEGVSRKWVAPGSSKVPSSNPLTSLSHPYRFSKMHSKMHSGHHDGIEPFAFRAQNMEHKGDVTACLYTNEAWLDELPNFVQRWNGPISLVFESLHPQDSPERNEVLRRIRALRSKEPLVRQLVDVHFLSNPPTSILSGNRSRERLLLNPIATNFHLNLARFFARTEMVWLVGDARIMPSLGLRKKLSVPSIRKLLLTSGDALVIPTFGSLRRTEEGAPLGIPSLKEIRSQANLDQAPTGGVSEEEFVKLASAYIEAHKNTLPIPMPKWPKKKATLVGLSSAHPPASVMAPGELPPSAPVFALWDQAWDPNRGPSNWSLWRKGSLDPRLQESAESGGGAGLGLSGGVGGGQAIYKVLDYELHYAPNVVIGRDSQPWCTERFETNKAACVYQMFLSGAGMWVLPDEWAFTLESMDKSEKFAGSEADKLKDSISSRLYTKFHAEACMHYGREFISLSLWKSDRAEHLRSTCGRVLSSWGIGSEGEAISK